MEPWSWSIQETHVPVSSSRPIPISRTPERIPMSRRWRESDLLTPMALSSKRALMTKGMPSPREYARARTAPRAAPEPSTPGSRDSAMIAA